MLSGRLSELQYLNQYYDREGNQILVIYGQKHIGKTTLAKEFVEDKPSYYYLARSCSEREQRFQWGMQLKADGKVDAISEKDFPGFYDIFASICGSGGSSQ